MASTYRRRRIGAGRALARAAGSAAALAAAVALLGPTRSDAYVLLGESLDLTQRDFRVHNNFTAPETNDNTTPDLNFPGAQGAVLALWKAAAEWGSELRGNNGQGDATQPFDLGSGGADFDFAYSGLAPDPGTTNDNVVSEIAGGGAGTFAFTELPIHDGWRIRFYAGATTWDDGPGQPVGGGSDLQGVATHEFGHALGLGHTFVDGATMKSGTAGTLVYLRSLHADDIAGVQAIYGVRSPNKPHVERYEVTGTQLTVHGAHFAALDNEVWFTPVGTGSGDLVRVTGVASTQSGTRIDVALPATAGPGDMLVRVPGTTGAALSNALPLDPLNPPCPGVRTYGTAKVNSLGATTLLSASGWPSVSTDNFEIRTANAPFSTVGVLFYGHGEAALPFLGGTLNVAGPWVRARPIAFDFFGGASVRVPVDASMVGTTRWYQIWYQDAGDPQGAGLSDGLEVTFCP